jgi:hypothetical protein
MEGDYPKHDYVMEREGLHNVCKYSTKTGSNVPENPHRHEKRVHNKILDDITDYIGNTPLVRMSNIARNDGIKCELCKPNNLKFNLNNT